MKAIQLVRYGTPDVAFAIRDIDKPSPATNEVLIKVEASGINFADIMARRGLYDDAPKPPSVLGYDVAGQIVAVGPNATKWAVGDRVFGMTRFGGYAEYALANTYGIAKIPDDLSFAAATALATQGCTAYFCAHECVRLHADDKVLIHAAAGGVGHFLVQMVARAGCHIIATASATKHDHLYANGVSLAIDYRNDDFTSQIHSAYGSRPVDIIFDAVGGLSFKKGMNLLSPGGRMVFYGASSQVKGQRSSKLSALKVAFGFGLFSPIQLIMHSRAMIGVNMLRIADHRPHILAHVLQQVTRLVQNQTLSPVLARTFPYEQIAEAHQYIESRQSIGKVAITW